MRSIFCVCLSAFSALILAGCGTVTPDFEQNPFDELAVGRVVNDTALHVRCQLLDAIATAQHDTGVDFLDKWSAEITMTLSVIESTNVDPALSLAHGIADPFKAFSLALAGVHHNKATRKIDITWFEDFKELIGGPLRGACKVPSAQGITGNLKLDEVLISAVFPATASKGAFFDRYKDKAGPIGSIQNTISFDLDIGGSATPALTFTNVVLSSVGASINFDRDRLNQLLITIGPNAISKSGRPLLATPRVSQEVSNAHQVGRIGLEFQTFFPQRGLFQ